jgi:predicted Rossmann fold flavoprotein
LKTIILGGGASGLFLAVLLKKDYLIIEGNSQIGRKIKVSGGGKCNITNKYVSPKNYRGDFDFVKNALDKFDNKSLLSWLKKNNLEVKELKKNQYFFNSSDVLLNFFKKSVKNVKLNTKILDVEENRVFTDKGVFEAENIVVATGGLSFKSLGATGIGYEIAKKIGHHINTLKPALVGFSVQKEQFWFKNLSGVSLKADVFVENKKFRDNILFSHRGITGPAILNASLWWERGKIKIDFLAGKNIDTFLKNPNKIISTQLPLPKRFVKEFLKSIDLEDKKVKSLSKEEFEKLKKINSYEFAPAGTFGFEKAEVTKGGVATDEIDEYMKSKLSKNFFFIGEVLDVTGELGGYNFQWAFTSAFNAFRFLSR